MGEALSVFWAHVRDQRHVAAVVYLGMAFSSFSH